MNGARAVRALGTVVALLAVTIVVTGLPAAPKAPGGQLDLKVAVWTNGRCGTFADGLPALVSVTAVTAGATAADTVICVSSNDKRGPALSMRVASRVETDVNCTGDETSVDPTCGGDAAGELGDSLLQQAGISKCGKNPPPLDPDLTRRLPALDSSVALGSLPSVGNTCVRLVLRYDPATLEAAVASQSDRATWQYAFELVGP